MKYSDINFSEEIMSLEAESAFSTEADQLSMLDNVLVSLLSKRAELLRRAGELDSRVGFYPKYVVFNNEQGIMDDDCFVLDPKQSEADIEAVEFYAEFTDDKALSEALRNWIYMHKNMTCKDPTRSICPVVGYNLCCGECSVRETCAIEGRGGLCGKVSSGVVTTIEECDINE